MVREVDGTGEGSLQPPVDFGRRHVVVKLEIPFRLGADDSQPSQIGRGSEPLQVGRGSELAHAYADALIAEIDANAPEFADCEVRAVRMGGGDVTTLRPEDIVRVMDAVRTGYAVAADMPVTLRVSSAYAEGSMLESWLRAGVTRVDREFPASDGSGWSSADRAGLDRPIADGRLGRGAILSFGGEGMAEGFGDVVARAVRDGVEHVVLERAMQSAVRGAGVAEVAEAQLTAARGVLADAGFKEYVPLHFAHEGCEDRFALLDAFGIDTLAFGVGAATRFSRTLTRNTSDLKRYLLGSSDYRLITQSSGPIVGR